MLALSRGSHTIRELAAHRLSDRADGQRGGGGDLAGERVRLFTQPLVSGEAGDVTPINSSTAGDRRRKLEQD